MHPSSMSNQAVISTQPISYQTRNTNQIVDIKLVANIIETLAEEYRDLPNTNSGERHLITNFTAALNKLTTQDTTTQDTTLIHQVAVQILNEMSTVKPGNNKGQFIIDLHLETKIINLIFVKDRVFIVDSAAHHAVDQMKTIWFESINFFELQQYLADYHKSQQSCCVNNEETITCATGWAVGCIANSMIGTGYGGFLAAPLAAKLKIPHPVYLAGPASTVLTILGGPVAAVGNKIGLCTVSSSTTNCCQRHDFENDMPFQHNMPDENMSINRTIGNRAPSNSEDHSSIKGASSSPTEDRTEPKESTPLLKKSE